jgi:hypothetical protein
MERSSQTSANRAMVARASKVPADRTFRKYSAGHDGMTPHDGTFHIAQCARYARIGYIGKWRQVVSVASSASGNALISFMTALRCMTALLSASGISPAGTRPSRAARPVAQ